MIESILVADVNCGLQTSAFGSDMLASILGSIHVHGAAHVDSDLTLVHVDIRV